ncbi:MAG: carboxypeptidase M32 [Candidatus Krumholzibacteria bacterium]|nr:carboxypeptidase M32 [Candidatus Krumholzibacteria bacterium]
MPRSYQQFLERLRQIQCLNGTMALLSWDQEVTMPPGGARDRAAHRAALAGVIHEKLVDPELAALLATLAEAVDLDAAARANVRLTQQAHARAVRLPAALVREQAQTASLAHGEWVQARAEDDWLRFAPFLDRLVDLKRQEAAALAIGDEPYDALLDGFETGARTADLLPVFECLRVSLAELLRRCPVRNRAPSPRPAGIFPNDRQYELCRRVLTAIGYDFSRGRLDISAHPFTETMGLGDVRVTTRYQSDNPLSGLYAVLHEGGHALYEQGLPADLRDLPAGQPASLGIHESQSQLWENFVGRSRAFCEWLAPLLRELFPTAYEGFAAVDFYRAANERTHTPIRIEADEIAYNLHIILRFEIERALIGGDLQAADVPALWREKARTYLDLDVRDDRTGALQDIHWCTGGFGYFPTYALGNLYAAMFWETAQRDLVDLEDQLAAGQTDALRQWLRDRIHARGAVLTAGELCREVTGRELDAAPFVAYLQQKYGELVDI